MKTFLYLLMLITVTACSTPVWRYGAEDKEFHPPVFSDTSLFVPEFRDARADVNETMTWSALLPLIPFYYPTVLMQDYAIPTSLRLSKDLNTSENLPSDILSSAAEDLATEFYNASLFEYVYFSPTKNAQSADYILYGTIEKTTYKRYITSYGFSVLVALGWVVNAPIGQTENELKVLFKLADRHNRVIWEKTYSSTELWAYTLYFDGYQSKFNSMFKKLNMQVLNDVKNVIEQQKQSHRK